MLIRDCAADDLDGLEQAHPRHGHTRRFRRQCAGESSYLIAVRDGIPVGHGELLWGGCRDDAVRAEYPDCPELNGLSVFPAELQGQGIGTAIVRAAEDRARDRGLQRIGLGVGDDNPRAARLYERLGYAASIDYVDVYDYVDAAGCQQVAEDPCRFMVKDLVHRIPYSTADSHRGR